jgi:hypothetical protein
MRNLFGKCNTALKIKRLSKIIIKAFLGHNGQSTQNIKAGFETLLPKTYR